MQRSVRINDHQIQTLFDRAKEDQRLEGYLMKRSSESSRWQRRWFVLYQNLLFYAESDKSARAAGIVFLEGSYCERLIPSSKDHPPPAVDKQVLSTDRCRRLTGAVD